MFKRKFNLNWKLLLKYNNKYLFYNLINICIKKFTELKNMDKNEIKNIDKKGIFKNCFD